MSGILELIQAIPIIAVTMISSGVADFEPPKACDAIQMAQAAPATEDGVPEQQWCCCGSCCNWAISCDAIPGCDSC